MKKGKKFADSAPEPDYGPTEQPSGGATGHGGADPADIKEPIERDGHTEPARPPEDFMNGKKSKGYSF